MVLTWEKGVATRASRRKRAAGKQRPFTSMLQDSPYSEKLDDPAPGLSNLWPCMNWGLGFLSGKGERECMHLRLWGWIKWGDLSYLQQLAGIYSNLTTMALQVAKVVCKGRKEISPPTKNFCRETGCGDWLPLRSRLNEDPEKPNMFKVLSP